MTYTNTYGYCVIPDQTGNDSMTETVDRTQLTDVTLLQQMQYMKAENRSIRNDMNE